MKRRTLTPHERGNQTTRLEQFKMVLTGDPHQIDNPYLDKVVQMA